MKTLRVRRALSALVVGACGASVLVALVPLIMIFAFILKQGVASLNLAFFTALPQPVGELGGGMGNAIVGTLVLVGIAAAFAVPVGLMSGLYVAEFKGSPLATAARFAADVLSGVPSIVVGIFAYAVAVLPFKQFSALAGGLALGIMMIPLVARTTEEMLRLVPGGLQEGALALGATRSRAIFTVVVPAALPGIATGVLVALARVAGETAPLLFTAFNSRYWSFSLAKPIASLTVQVYTYAISPYDDWHRQAWAGAFVLVALVSTLSLAARIATRRITRLHRA